MNLKEAFMLDEFCPEGIMILVELNNNKKIPLHTTNGIFLHTHGAGSYTC